MATFTMNGTSEPELRPIKGGWAASGNGWAVHALTREEAIQKFKEAERQHEVIDSRPYWYEQVETGPLHEGADSVEREK